MHINNIVKNNRSYRRFRRDQVIAEETLLELIELARISPSGRNQQALKFVPMYCKKTADRLFPALKWAGFIEGWGGPSEEERPPSYIMILGDTTLTDNFYCDHGIAAQSILLGAVEKGLGGCILGALNHDMIRKEFSIPDHLEILLVLAIGKPSEKVVIEEMRDNDIKYYRDEENVHHVPKRRLEDIIIEFDT